jgi:predicted TIM-barrel fold metal-dependent hydrolase
MIIDAHTHPFGPPSYADLAGQIRTVADVVGFRTRHPALYEARLTETARDFAPELMSDMDRHGIARAVIQGTAGRMTNELVADTVRRYPDRLVGLFRVGSEGEADGVFDNVEHVRREVASQVAFCVETLQLSACGELPVRAFTRALHPEEIATDLRPLMTALSKYQIAVQIPTGWSQFPGGLHLADPLFVDEIATRHPDVPIVLTKMGRGIQHYFESALIVAMRNPNVYLDTVATTAAHLRRAVDVIGPDRIMFGTDWSPTWRWVRAPMDLYELRFRTLKEAALTRDEEDQILWKTAARLFKVPLGS